jgi:hypothetical protein
LLQPGASSVSMEYMPDGGADRVFFNSRLALLIGFGGLLLIMGLAGIDALRVLQQFRHSDEQISHRYLSQNHVLNDIRSDVYVSGTFVLFGLSSRIIGESWHPFFNGIPRKGGIRDIPF